MFAFAQRFLGLDLFSHVSVGTEPTDDLGIAHVDGDRDGVAGRRLRGGLRLCECGVVDRREQQAGADLNAKIFMASVRSLWEARAREERQ